MCNARDSIAQTRPVTIIGILLALFGFLFLGVLEFATGISVGRVESSLFKWVLVGAVVLIILRFERKSLASIGIAQPDRWDILAGIALFVSGLLSFLVAATVVDALGFSIAPFDGDPNGTTDRTITALLVGLFVGVTAGITEEILYRGYALERLEGLSGSTVVAGTVTAFLFVVVHYGGHAFGGLLVITPVAVLLTVGYVWRRNLFVPVIGHVLINSFEGLVSLFARLLGLL